MMIGSHGDLWHQPLYYVYIPDLPQSSPNSSFVPISQSLLFYPEQSESLIKGSLVSLI